MDKSTLIPNLFRTEFGKIVGVLCKTFGISNIHLAEDIASETFLIATKTWSLKGIPDNPKAWLYAVAKNKTKDYFKRQAIYNDKVLPQLSIPNNIDQELDIDLSKENIEDSQLRMLFNVCNPLLSSEAQISLALRVLFGFGISEIATALLTSKSTINKRLQRAKDSYKKNNIKLELPTGKELDKRQDNVLGIIYLLFNEGYYSSISEQNIRKHLCLESMRLLYLFIDYQNTPQANALMALFCFHASRLEARIDEFGNSILYKDQDTIKWNQDLITKGEHYLQKSAFGDTVSKYHLEASIAFWHTKPKETKQKWESILQLYNQLLQIEYSSITALNRTYVLSKVHGKQKAIIEALKINSKDNHLYHMLLAELYKNKDNSKQIQHLEKALILVKTKSERTIIKIKMEEANRE